MVSLLWPAGPPLISAFDALVERLRKRNTSITESDALGALWRSGEDARLREDIRFRPTPSGRWMLAEARLLNEQVVAHLQTVANPMLLEEAMAFGAGAQQAFLCFGDPRLEQNKGKVYLAGTCPKAPPKPYLEVASQEQKYATHLPVYDLKAAAASPGQWGNAATSQVVGLLNWTQVKLDYPLTSRHFIAQVIGDSMDDGKSGLVDGVWALFALYEVDGQHYAPPIGIEPIELIRGSFTDPELGSYIIKRVTSQGTGVRLVSLNPDKQRYPDIPVRYRELSDIRRVAQLIRPLSPGEYRHRAPSAPRKRDLTDHHEISRSLQERSKAFFDSPSSPGPVGVGSTPRHAQLVCLSKEEGGLHIETLPLSGLPALIPVLAVGDGQFTRKVPASNLRARVFRTPVPPSTLGYSWSAPDLPLPPGLLDPILKPLALTGLPGTTATIFRIGASDVGRHVSGRALHPGQRYRFLLPPALKAVVLPEGALDHLKDGWRLWTLSVPSQPSPKLQEAFLALDLSLGTSTPSVYWSLTAPAAWRTTARGVDYPCFLANTPPVLSIAGLTITEPGQAKVFLQGKSLQEFDLPPGDTWTLALRDLEPGDYLLEVRPLMTDTAISRLSFAIIGAPPPPPSASVLLELDGQLHALVPGIPLTLTADLTDLMADENNSRLQVCGPPLWPIWQSWQGASRQSPVRSFADLDGQADIASIAQRTRQRRELAWRGLLRLELGEVGQVDLLHSRQPSVEGLRDQVKQLVDKRGKAAKPAAEQGMFLQLRKIWLQPLLEIIGFSLHDLPEELLDKAPPGMTAWRLEVIRQNTGGFSLVPRRVLVLAKPSVELRGRGEGSIREFADTVCAESSLDEALLTDGFRWVLHQAGSRLRPKPMELLESLADLLDWEDLLATLSTEL